MERSSSSTETPTLETERLLIRPFIEDDLQGYHDLFNDPKVAEWLFLTVPHPVDESKAALKHEIRDYERHGIGRMAIVHQESGQMIGRTGIRHLNDDGAEIPEVAYVIRSDFWGQGLATEASRRVRDWGFQDLQYEALYSIIWSDNKPSMKVAEKNGFRWWKDTMQITIPHQIWRITREEWEAHS